MRLIGDVAGNIDVGGAGVAGFVDDWRGQAPVQVGQADDELGKGQAADLGGGGIAAEDGGAGPGRR